MVNLWHHLKDILRSDSSEQMSCIIAACPLAEPIAGSEMIAVVFFVAAVVGTVVVLLSRGSEALLFVEVVIILAMVICNQRRY